MEIYVEAKFDVFKHSYRTIFRELKFSGMQEYQIFLGKKLLQNAQQPSKCENYFVKVTSKAAARGVL